MASRLPGLFKFPWRAKKKKESQAALYEELFKAEQDAAPEKNALTESNAAPGKHAAELFATKENAGPQRDAAPESYTAPGKNATERIVWSPGTRVVGKYDFKGRTREDLPFKKGEILIIETVTRDPNCYRAVDSEGRKGMIPFNFVRKCLTYPVEPVLWFHGDISRIETKRLLNPCEDGLFLIRNSYYYKGDYTLSVRYANKVEHYRVRVTVDGKLTIDDHLFYGSLSELVEHYSKGADGLCTRLAKPAAYKGETFYTSIDRRWFDNGGWEINRTCLYSRNCIRRGDFGDIFQAEYLSHKVTVKKYSAKSYQDVQAFLLEAAIMTNLQHRNIVKLLGVSSTEDPFYLVTEFCAKGNLLEFLSGKGSSTIQEDDLVNVAQDVARGMEYLQSKNVVHRALMARNILIDEDGTAKVSEFGLAQMYNSSSERKNTSDKWAAPEAIREGIFSPQSDVWSYGVLLWVLFSFGENPYSELPADQLVDKIEEGYRMKCPKACNTVIYGMMSNCWNIDPRERPSFKEIYKLLANYFYDEVPKEIRARGRLALKAYKKALSEGKTCVKRVPIMLIGQDRSGKTSLAKSLKGERFNLEEDSTIGIDVGPSYFSVSTELWKPGERDQQQNVERACSYEHHAARLIVQNLSVKESAPIEESLASDQVEHLVQVESIETSVSEDIVLITGARDENILGSCSQSEEDIFSVPAAPVTSDTTSHDSVSNPESEDIPVGSVSISVSQDQTISDQNPADNIQTVPDDVASLVEVLLREDDLKCEEDIYSVLWDFGGQAVYYTTHPLFLTDRAIYLLVNDLSRNLHGEAKSVMKQGMFTKLQDSFRLKTNADYLDFWMSSVASLATQDERNSKSDVLSKLPPVFLVCTHADKPNDGGNPRELGRMVFGHLRTKPYKGHLQDFFIVDNTKSGDELECPEVVRLRQEIRAVAKELPHMKEAVPIRWLKFETEMQATKDKGYKWIFLEEAKGIATDMCNVADDEEFRTLLNFLHDQRVLIHFDDTPELNKMVVLDAQWLIDVFKEVITIRPFDSNEKKFEELWLRLENEGILEEPLLEHVWGSLYHKEDTCQGLIAIMEKFSLLCSWPFLDDSCSKQYLVPSMLMSHPPEEIMELVVSAEIPPLFIKFESGQVPPGLFPRLVLQFLQWCKQECTSPDHPQLYHNFVRIYDSKEENCSVILLCHMSSIEVVAHRGDDGHEVAHCSKSEITSPVENHHDAFACAVLRQLKLVLESMRREFCWLQNMKYEISFLCPVCCRRGAVSYCRTHRTKNCKQEECFHFWPESKLFSDKKMICCTRSETAKMNRVSLKNFEPWFFPMRNQFAVDNCGDGNLASVEDGEENFSANEFLRIRLTQRRDDQNISPQLKESLQLEEASPETLESDSKRGDMVQNLDKTTTTTEVSLPDNVKQSLLSASCNANEIVQQLKENLQLDKDALEQPDPDTKIIIRNLAQKAKDLRRLDVFEHLREIVPAGTTGPLLPENLPVQNMPISKARELTIDLVGGDEWMELAEGLGLTPQEIRFLDKRTLNPMDAALSFIAKQRHLSVGELYELLIAHDFPMLADLL